MSLASRAWFRLAREPTAGAAGFCKYSKRSNGCVDAAARLFIPPPSSFILAFHAPAARVQRFLSWRDQGTGLDLWRNIVQTTDKTCCAVSLCAGSKNSLLPNSAKFPPLYKALSNEGDCPSESTTTIVLSARFFLPTRRRFLISTCRAGDIQSISARESGARTRLRPSTTKIRTT